MMKMIVIAAALLASAGAANAQSGSSTMPNPDLAASSKAGDPTVKPKGQIIPIKSPTDHKRVGVRAHCSNGTVYWDPKIADSEYYCDGKDAPAAPGQ